jgi:O-antigen/teichoic acid export membrane protein
MQETRLLALIVLLSLAPAAQAYLDPSTGSLILSAIVGLIATIGLAVKTWWYRIKSLFRRNPASTEGDTTQSLRD